MPWAETELVKEEGAFLAMVTMGLATVVTLAILTGLANEKGAVDAVPPMLAQ